MKILMNEFKSSPDRCYEAMVNSNAPCFNEVSKKSVTELNVNEWVFIRTKLKELNIHF